VRLLTHPPSAGYSQNPISVYYCYGAGGAALERCIAEVTNTPWAERVTFMFRYRVADLFQCMYFIAVSLALVAVAHPFQALQCLILQYSCCPLLCPPFAAMPQTRLLPACCCSSGCSTQDRNTSTAPGTIPHLCRPGGEEVPKALHVSPLMDMRSTW